MPVATPPVTHPTAQITLCMGMNERQITSRLKDSREEADDEHTHHTASEQDSGDAERNRGSTEKTETGDLTKKEEVFTGINARRTIAGGLGRQSTQLEQEEPDEILCMGWKKLLNFDIFFSLRTFWLVIVLYALFVY
ncbi:hypothetical protein BT96DRAFT_1008517 [Gymnopus androsaceus JB14]|uniref:Uncharacterized protein n=1 Tax=Gymnopus androsaceus JB14 TaxID=1447944 RepID=A0A6A4GFA5_9AGAR|nr:hypothetical protein BT96DRAFT_1008517 [Gymnopus androsaceus JB14]